MVCSSAGRHESGHRERREPARGHRAQCGMWRGLYRPKWPDHVDRHRVSHGRQRRHGGRCRWCGVFGGLLCRWRVGVVAVRLALIGAGGVGRGGGLHRWRGLAWWRSTGAGRREAGLGGRCELAGLQSVRTVRGRHEGVAGRADGGDRAHRRQRRPRPARRSSGRCDARSRPARGSGECAAAGAASGAAGAAGVRRGWARPEGYGRRPSSIEWRLIPMSEQMRRPSPPKG